MTKPIVRCAIYTRKSSDEGLDQEFNSLDAQFEACANYIASQRHEGWRLAKKRYDDGGMSGGTLDRPCLTNLLADIETGKIQMIVVYKIDRLTRSLADFAKLVERLEACNCSFVSVTQSFNTSSSMGRLTLNVLLSFAQFEREVTAERIRDKIAASKKKGLWMGGVCPIGYDKDPDPQSRTLIVNQDEAQRVKKLFRLYYQFGVVKLVETEARNLNLRSKRHLYATGRVAGDRPFTRGQIYHILRNPIYIGRIRHKDLTWPGQHEAIIDQTLWDGVQEKLIAASLRKRGRSASNEQSILIGKLCDETGDPLTPSYTTKHGRKFRYYVSNRLIAHGTDPSGLRLPAPKLEKQIASIIANHIENQASHFTLTTAPDVSAVRSIQKQASTIVDNLRSNGLIQYSDLIDVIQLHPITIQVRLAANPLGERLGIDSRNLSLELIEFDVPWTLKRRGVENKIIIGEPSPELDQTLIRMLTHAHQWVNDMKAGIPLNTIAQKQGVTPAYIRTRSRLAFLSPKIQQAILAGTLTPEFTMNCMLQMKIPRDWCQQNTLFGI
jgi:site-specific DNA recombinase